MSRSTVLSIDDRFKQAALGGQGPIVIAAVPSGGNEALVGTLLVDAGSLTVLGTYRCLIPLSGLVSSVAVYLQATFASGTVTSDLDSLYWVRSVSDPSTWTKKTLTSDNNLGVHGGSAHLDGPGTGTYVDRPGENKDPNVRTNSKSSVTIKLYKIGHTKL